MPIVGVTDRASVYRLQRLTFASFRLAEASQSCRLPHCREPAFAPLQAPEKGRLQLRLDFQYESALGGGLCEIALAQCIDDIGQVNASGQRLNSSSVVGAFDSTICSVPTRKLVDKLKNLKA